jgi:hypothetical protein
LLTLVRENPFIACFLKGWVMGGEGEQLGKLVGVEDKLTNGTKNDNAEMGSMEMNNLEIMDSKATECKRADRVDMDSLKTTDRQKTNDGEVTTDGETVASKGTEGMKQSSKQQWNLKHWMVKSRSMWKQSG